MPLFFMIILQDEYQNERYEEIEMEVVIDTSAILAVILDEPERDRLIESEVHCSNDKYCCLGGLTCLYIIIQKQGKNFQNFWKKLNQTGKS